MEISIIKIKNVVSGLLNWVRQDLINNELTPTKSWLYEEFSTIDLDDTNFYTSLKSMIEQGEDDRRRLEVRLMFDIERANLPTIHIHYPSEDGRSGDNTLNTGYTGNIGDINVDRDQYSRSFIGQYELIITGGNSLEVIMLYECLDALLIAGADTLAHNFDIFQFSGKQLLANTDLIPHLTYYRAIGLSLQNKKKVSSIISRTRAHDIQFEGVLTNESMQPRLVSITIEADQLLPYLGESVHFTAVAFNGGNQPVYNWYIDDVLVEGHNSNLLTLVFSGDTTIVRCELESSITSLLPNPVISNEVLLELSGIVNVTKTLGDAITDPTLFTVNLIKVSDDSVYETGTVSVDEPLVFDRVRLGEYRIEEVLDPAYELISITPNLVTVDIDNLSENVVVINGVVVANLALESTWNDYDFPVSDPSNVGEWNLIFGRYTGIYANYTSVEVSDLIIKLYGGNGVILSSTVFSDNSFDGHRKELVVSVIDNAGSVTTLDPFAFAYCSNLELATFPSATSVGVQSFIGCISLREALFPNTITIGGGVFYSCNSLEYVDLSSLVTFGEMSFGDGQVFQNISGATITLKIPAHFMTDNGGLPHEEIQYLIDNNTVTILDPSGSQIYPII